MAISRLEGQLFPTGKTLVTRGVWAESRKSPAFALFVARSLERHIKGDWGDLSPGDRRENELSLKRGFRLLSAYQEPGLPKIWVVTEADRSVTTVLFPEEY